MKLKFKKSLTIMQSIHFHIGQWIVKPDGSIFRICDFTSDTYEVEDTNGNISSINRKEAEDNCRVWTFERDAKWGDTVVMNTPTGWCIYIIKSICGFAGQPGEKVEFLATFDYSNNMLDFWDGFVPYSNITTMKRCFPATAEQRKLIKNAILKLKLKLTKNENKITKSENMAG